MAKADIGYHDLGGRTNPVVRRFPVVKNNTAILAGEPVGFPDIGGGVNRTYVIVLADNTPLIGTDYFVGVAAAAGTHTTTADGYVDVYIDFPGMIWKARAKTTTLADTQSEVDSTVGYTVSLDLTSSTYTVDTGTRLNAGGIMIVGGDPSQSLVYFIVRDRARFSN